MSSLHRPRFIIMPKWGELLSDPGAEPIDVIPYWSRPAALNVSLVHRNNGYMEARYCYICGSLLEPDKKIILSACQRHFWEEYVVEWERPQRREPWLRKAFSLFIRSTAARLQRLLTVVTVAGRLACFTLWIGLQMAGLLAVLIASVNTSKGSTKSLKPR